MARGGQISWANFLGGGGGGGISCDTGYDSYYYVAIAVTILNRSLTDRIQVLKLLCQMFLIDNFYHDKYTCSKASVLAIILVKITYFYHSKNWGKDLPKMLMFCD
jgi:hypothetical protein